MTCQESEEVVVKCLELECVLGLVRLHKWIDNQSNWNGFDLLKQVLEVVQVQLPHGLILWALYQRKDKTFENGWGTRVFLGRKFVKELEHADSCD